MAYDSNLGKQAVIFTVILLLSLGLCGYGLHDSNGTSAVLGGIGIPVGFIGLLVTGINALTRRNKP